MSSANYKILIADEDGLQAMNLSKFLEQKAFECKVCKSGLEAKSIIDQWQPHFSIVNMVLSEFSGIQLLEHCKSNKIQTKFFMTSSHNNIENVRKALKTGADDYIVKPYREEDMLSRIIFHIQKKKKIELIKSNDNKNEYAPLLHLLDLVLREATSQKTARDKIFTHTKMLSLTLKAVRCNVMYCHPDRQRAFVMVSSDDKSLNGLQLDMNKYPEVIHVMNTERMVVIENLDNDPTMAKIKENVQTIQFNAIIVCPLFYQGEFYGVISARMPKEHSNFKDSHIRFTQLLSYAVSCVINMDQKKQMYPNLSQKINDDEEDDPLSA